jgi:hypothetical protein
MFESTRLVDIADPVALDERSVEFRSDIVTRRFDSHLGAAFRENALDPELFPAIW